MVQLVNVIDKIPDENVKEFYLYQMMPISIEKVKDSIYMVQFMCDIYNTESKDIIYIIVGFVCTDDTELKKNDLYISNIKIDKKRSIIYDKLIKGSNSSNTYQTEFNISKNDKTGFFETGLRNISNHNISKMYLNKNMFLRISLFIQCLFSLGNTITDIFSNPSYEFIQNVQFTGNNFPPRKTTKFIINNGIIYCIYKDSKLRYMEIPLDKFKNNEENL